MGQITLVVGGGRSGKSAFSQGLARGYKNVVYVATAQATDEEMRRRIEEHQKCRPAHWRTVEAPQDLGASLEGLSAQTQFVIIDCLTLYLNNFILGRESDKQRCRQEWEQELSCLLAVAQRIKPALVFVSNEVGQGIVPANSLGRFYRDLHGAMNQAVARVAERVYKMEVGIPIKIK